MMGTADPVPPIISVDDHVVEPPHVFSRWLSRKHRDRAPHVVRAPFELVDTGGVGGRKYRMASSGPETDFWVYDDLITAIHVGMACAGLPPDSIDEGPIAFDAMRPGCYEPKARLADMDVIGVERSLCFPSMPRFCGQTFLERADKELALACITAYNDWMVDEWCGDSGGRLIPLCLIPLWDPQLAADEVRRNAARGVRAVAFTELPTRLDLPSLYQEHWDPFLAACAETTTVICIHIGSASYFTISSPDCPVGARIANLSINSQLSLTDWLLCGALQRFPALKVAFSESQIGWMPYLFERIDRMWKKGFRNSEINPLITSEPSSYIPGRIYGCFFEDDFGLESRHAVGIDQITFETDYPHQDSTWPHTLDYVRSALGHLTPVERYKILRGNALGLFDLAEDLPGQREGALT